MASSVIMPTFGQAFSLEGLARETICTSTGTVRASLVVRAASSCVCSRSNSARLDLARLSSARTFTSSPPELTTRLLASSRRRRTPSSRMAETFASRSSPSTILSTSARICRLRPARSALSCFMRGCAGSSVADSSAICRSTRTRCSTRRGTSCDFCTSGKVSPAPRAAISRASLARASVSARTVAILVSSAFSSDSCCSLRPVLSRPPSKMLDWPRKRVTSASASATSSASFLICGRELGARIPCSPARCAGKDRRGRAPPACWRRRRRAWSRWT